MGRPLTAPKTDPFNEMLCKTEMPHTKKTGREIASGSGNSQTDTSLILPASTRLVCSPDRNAGIGFRVEYPLHHKHQHHKPDPDQIADQAALDHHQGS